MTSIQSIASLVHTVWSIHLVVAVVAKLLITLGRKSRWLTALVTVGGRVHQELWPIVPAAVLIEAVQHWHSGSWYLVFFDMVALYNWWVLRDFPDDENRWKRRGKKLKDAVAVRAGRLVVVPAGASA